MADVNVAGLEETQKLVHATQPDAKLILQKCDISIEKDCNDLIQRAVESFGTLHYLVNCAGITGGFASTVEQEVGIFDQVHGVNVRGTWICQRAAIQQMLKQELRDGG